MAEYWKFTGRKKSDKKPAQTNHHGSIVNIAVNDIDEEIFVLIFPSENANDKVNMTIKCHYGKETQQPESSPKT